MFKAKPRFIIIVLLLIAVLALVAGCSNGSSKSSETTDSSGGDSSSPGSAGSGTDQDNPGESTSPASSLTLAEQYIVFSAPTPALTPRFHVNSTNDTVDANPGDAVCDDGAGNCTLRAAIMEANALTGTDAIALPAGIYSITISGVDEDASRTGDFDITDELVILGSGMDATIIDAGGLDRVFHVLPSTAVYEAWRQQGSSLDNPIVGPRLEISGVTIRNGLAGVTVRNGIVSKDRERERRNGGIPDWSRGGGIAVRDSALTLTDSAVTGNAATHGGGIWKRSRGKLAISHSAISGNFASDDGGGVSATGTLTLSDSTITENSGGNGGGIYSSGEFTLLDSTVSGNTAKDGGGVYLIWFGSLNAHGGTIYDSTVEGNTARFEGGGIWSAASLTLIDSSVKENAAATDDIYVPRRCNNCTAGSGSFDEIVTASGGDAASAETLKQAAKAYATGEYRKALDLRLALAQEGSGEAQIRLGWMLYGGDGVDQSFEGAAHWWEIAAVQGLAEAQNLLGGLYNLGKGVTQDYQKAAEWYHQAASQGLQWAEINIGGLWFNGDGVAQNHVMAAYWFAKAEIGDDREASDQASHWVLRSKRVAERLQSRPIDYLNMAPEEREKLSHDDITAGLIGVAIASVVWAGVQSDWVIILDRSVLKNNTNEMSVFA